MPGKKSQVIGGSVLTLLVVGLALRILLGGADRLQRQQQHDADMKRQIESIDREFRLIEQQFSTENLRATSQRSDEPPQGEAEGEEGGASEAAPVSHP